MMSRTDLAVVLFLAVLAIATGAVSFNSRKPDMGLATSVAHLDLGWELLTSRGERPESERANLNVTTAARRLLMPSVVMAVSRLTGLSHEQAFSLVRLVSIYLAYVVFHYFLRRSFSLGAALLGTLFVAATIPLTFLKGFEVLTDFPELLIFTLGVWSIQADKGSLFWLVVLIGTLNRETTVLLVVAYLCAHATDALRPRRAFWMVAAGLTWLAVQRGISSWIHNSYGWGALHELVVAHNAEGLRHLLVNWNPYNNYLLGLYFFGLLWVLPFAAWRRLPGDLRRMFAVVVPLHVAIWVAFGMLDEPRQLVCLYPIVVPAALWALGAAGLTPLSPRPRMAA